MYCRSMVFFCAACNSSDLTISLFNICVVSISFLSRLSIFPDQCHLAHNSNLTTSRLESDNNKFLKYKRETAIVDVAEAVNIATSRQQVERDPLSDKLKVGKMASEGAHTKGTTGICRRFLRLVRKAIFWSVGGWR